MMPESLIAILSQASGPSGHEQPVLDIIKGEISSLVNDLVVDQMGNLIASINCPTSNSKRLMISAHTDEVGLIVSHVDDKGFARFNSLGPWNLQTAVGSRVKFLGGQVGIIGCDADHIEPAKLTADRLFIDTGATSPQDCQLKIGDLAVFDTPFLETGRRFFGKALDDRIGVALLVELIQLMNKNKFYSPYDLFFIFSCQGQLGSRGAMVAAFGIEPDMFLSVDLTDSSETPKSAFSGIEIGKGPAIRIRDQAMLSNPNFVSWIQIIADKEKIPHQFEILTKGEKRLDRVQTVRSGVVSAALSIPARYLHSSTEMADYGDIENALQLLTALIVEPFQGES